jgi:hypothetical protein
MDEATPTPEIESLPPQVETPVEEKRGRGRPLGSKDQIKRLPKGSLHPDKVQEGMLPPDVVARIRGGTGVIPIREKARLHAAAEKIRRDEAKKEASETALSRPIPESLAKPAPTEKQKLYVREAIERVIALAKVEGTEKSRLDALIDKAYLLAMDSSTDLEMLLRVISLFADRLEGKATQNINHGEGAAVGPLALTINVNATRFQVKTPAPNEGVIDAE